MRKWLAIVAVAVSVGSLLGGCASSATPVPSQPGANSGYLPGTGSPSSPGMGNQPGPGTGGEYNGQ
ncbi:MAG: hypothetical protein M0037_01125 [Betaproteobacteria bacterium]|nr:hypothetical protein [Betaproteobacteria bacterium]